MKIAFNCGLTLQKHATHMTQKMWVQKNIGVLVSKILGQKKFGQKKFCEQKLRPQKSLVKITSVSNSLDIADMDKCHQDICCLDEYHRDSWHLLKMVPGINL